MIHPEDEVELRGLLLIPDEEPLPEALESLYLRVQKCRNRRYGGRMALDLLVMIVMQAGLLPGAPVKAQVAESPAFHTDDEVEVLYREQWQPGVVKGTWKNGIRVQIAGDEAPYRVIKPQNIRVLEHA
jgi:hypothetical protein